MTQHEGQAVDLSTVVGASESMMEQSLFAIAQLEVDIVQNGIPDFTAPRGWTCEEVLKLIVIEPICKRAWTIMANLIGSRTPSSIKYQVHNAMRRRNERHQEPDGNKDENFIPEDFICASRSRIAAESGAPRTDQEAYYLGNAIIAEVEEDARINGIPDFATPLGWSKKQILMLIALVPVCGRRWKLITSLLGVQRRSSAMHYYEKAVGRQKVRCEKEKLPVDGPLLPEDFSPTGLDDATEELRETVLRELEKVDANIRESGEPAEYVYSTWCKSDLLKLIAMVPICGNRWKFMSEFLEDRSPGAVRYQIQKANLKRIARNNYIDPDDDFPYILQDFSASRNIPLE